MGVAAYFLDNISMSILFLKKQKEYMGRFFVQPVVIKNYSSNVKQLKPYWNKVIYQHNHCGDILGMFQLNYMVMIFFAIINC